MRAAIGGYSSTVRRGLSLGLSKTKIADAASLDRATLDRLLKGGSISPLSAEGLAVATERLLKKLESPDTPDQ